MNFRTDTMILVTVDFDNKKVDMISIPRDSYVRINNGSRFNKIKAAFTFGGGFVIIPLMRERFVKELHWIDEEEMLDLTAIAQSSPGSIAINASILVGYHVAGIPGALITVVGAALPPLIIISIISVFYQAFRSNKYVSMAMAGMLAGVAAVIFDVVINMMWPILKKKRWLPITVMLAAFVATRFFSVNIILIILVCGVIGALDTLYLQKREGDK